MRTIGVIAAGACMGGMLCLAEIAAGQTNPPLKPGFPITLPAGSKAVRAGHPAIADLGLTPGHKSIIFGTSGHQLIVVNVWPTPAIAAGFPVALPSEVSMSPSVGDLDGDGVPEIVVAFGSTFEGPTSPGGVRAYHRDGTLLWSFTPGDFNLDGIPDAVVSSPAIGDIDGDGKPEVVFGGFDGNVHVLDGKTGLEKPGWPAFVRDSIYSSPALHDIDGDGRLDIIIGVDAHLEGPPYNTPDGGCLHVFRYDKSEVPGFPRCINQVFWSSPAVGDIDGDGRPEIVIGTGTFYGTPNHNVYAFKCDGSQAAGWPATVDGQVSTSPALADLDGDGILDVVVTDDMSPPSTAFHVYGIKGNGVRLWKTIPKSYFGTTPNAGDPLIADVTGDSDPEILVAINTEICVLSKAGVQLTYGGSGTTGSFSYFTDTALAGAAIDDMESDGVSIEVVAVSAVPLVPTSAKVYVWNPKAPTTPPWGHYKQNAKRLGVVPGTPSCPNLTLSTKLYAITPCRILDTRNVNGPLGGPILAAQSMRIFPLSGACGVPAGAKSLAANVTVTQPAAAGNLRLYPGNIFPPLMNSLSFAAGQTRASNSVVKLATDGSVTVGIYNESNGTVHAIVDVNGYFQ